MSADVMHEFPHSFRVLTVSRLYRRLALVTLIPVGMAIVHRGAPALALVATVLVGALTADVFITRVLVNSPVSPGDGRSLYLGLALAGILPLTTPLPVAFAAAILSVLVGVWLFGGPGRYWVHPAIIGPALAGIALTGTDAMRRADSFLAELIPPEVVAVLERSFFEPLGVRVSPDAWQLLLGTVSLDGGSLVLGMVGPILLGALIMFGEDLLSPILPAFFLIAYVLFVWIFGGVPDGWGNGAPLDAVFLTNAPFVVVFLAADPGVRPATSAGMALFGVFAGSLAALLWISAVVEVPVIIAFFITGMFVPLLDGITTRRL